MKKFLILFFWLCVITVAGFSFLAANATIFQSDAVFVWALSKNIYKDVPELSQTIVVYQSNGDISNYEVHSSCNSSSRFLGSEQNLFFFEFSYTDQLCENANIVLSYEGKRAPSSLTSLNIRSDFQEYNIFLDYSTEDLEKFLASLEKEIQKNALYKNYNGMNFIKNFKFAKGQRVFLEASHRKNMIQSIISGREKKYSVPAEGYKISELFTKIPNSWRPYREWYTLWIHQWWDIDAPMGTPVQALDDGIIVRVVRNFQDSDFSRIQYGSGLSLEQKQKNLDILRGNQVWLKTLKWEVVFYSHLSSVPQNISEKVFVKRGDILWAVGITGVPEIGYEDYHLHFEIMENPYVKETAGTYDIGDYMQWKWKTQGMDHAQTVAAQKNIFE